MAAPSCQVISVIGFISLLLVPYPAHAGVPRRGEPGTPHQPSLGSEHSEPKSPSETDIAQSDSGRLQPVEENLELPLDVEKSVAEQARDDNEKPSDVNTESDSATEEVDDAPGAKLLPNLPVGFQERDRQLLRHFPWNKDEQTLQEFLKSRNTELPGSQSVDDFDEFWQRVRTSEVTERWTLFWLLVTNGSTITEDLSLIIICKLLCEFYSCPPDCPGFNNPPWGP